MQKEKNTAKGNLYGVIIVNMKEIFQIIIQKDKVHTYGGTEDNIPGIGKIIKWKDMGNFEKNYFIIIILIFYFVI